MSVDMSVDKRDFYEEDDEIVIDFGALLHDFMKGIRRFWWLGLLLIVIGAAGYSWFSDLRYTPLYESKVSFTIVPGLNSDGKESETYVYNYSKNNASLMAEAFPHILDSSAMQKILKEDLGTNEINGEITASAIANTNIFTVKVVSDSAKDAFDIVNAVIEDYPEVAQYVIGDSKLNIIQEPMLAEEPYNELSIMKNLVLGAAAGGFLFMAFLFFYAITRRTIRQEEDIQEKLNKNCFGVVPVVRKNLKNKHGEIVLSKLNVGNSFRENMISIATRIHNEMKKLNARILLITSAGEDEGKSVVAANLASALGQRGQSVILVDADFYKSTVSLTVQQNTGEYLPGLRDYYLENTELEKMISHSEDMHCDIISSGMGNGYTSVEILSSSQIGNLLKQLSERYDYVIIDTPSCEELPDAAEISRYADAAIMVIRHDYSKVSQIMEAMENLYDSRIQIAGCILNGLEKAAVGGKYGYDKYGYGKYGSGKYGYGGYGNK